jgi:integrase
MAGSVRKDGSLWYYVIERTIGGKRKQTKKRGFKIKKEAQRALSEAENEVHKGTYIEATKLLV